MHGSLEHDAHGQFLILGEGRIFKLFHFWNRDNSMGWSAVDVNGTHSVNVASLRHFGDMFKER